MLQQVVATVASEIKAVDKWAAADKARPSFGMLREEQVWWGIARALRNPACGWDVVFLEYLYTHMAAAYADERKGWSRYRCDIAAANGRGFLIGEVKVGGQRRTDLNAPRTFAWEVMRDAGKLVWEDKIRSVQRMLVVVVELSAKSHPPSLTVNSWSVESTQRERLRRACKDVFQKKDCAVFERDFPAHGRRSWSDAARWVETLIRCLSGSDPVSAAVRTPGHEYRVVAGLL